METLRFALTTKRKWHVSGSRRIVGIGSHNFLITKVNDAIEARSLSIGKKPYESLNSTRKLTRVD
jgi:hypothetical protein